MIDLDEITHAASCLEPLPASALQLARLMCLEEPDLAAIVKVVELDQAITAVVLRAANSSWSASRTPITTVRDAVVRLGAGPVTAMAFGTNVRSRVARAIPEYGLAEGELWEHSVAATVAAELLVRRAPAVLPAETVTAALLHDVGKLVMSRFLSDDLLAALAERSAQGRTRLDVEAEVLGVQHAELGGLILQCWTLPDSLVRGVTYHHTPGISLAPIAYGVHLADVIAKLVRGGDDDNSDVETFAHAMAELSLSSDAFDEICALTEGRRAEVLATFTP